MVDADDFLNTAGGRFDGFAVVDTSNPVQWVALATTFVGSVLTALWLGVIRSIQGLGTAITSMIDGVSSALTEFVRLWLFGASESIESAWMSARLILEGGGIEAFVLSVAIATATAYIAAWVVNQLNG